ncbi:putative m7GpppX diphosphatase isoform X1 [Apostichopus japonicus]|uniref:m7GpppX diphosphatase n=1 Tax=Stichopus japonicus TaxID=307972 RepID=A0A2G8KJ67_STIJA|nr:putative m7GpppX diphosphatase isoform X1 [Apostichopus japonicus]
MPNIFKMAAPMKNKRDNSKENDGTSQAAKKLKLATDLHSDVDENVLHDFDGFKVDKILSESAESKSLFLLGSFSESAKKAVVLLEKKPFLSDDLTLKSLMSKETKLKLGLKNDIYGAYESFPPVEVNGVKTTVIYPATDKHINKYKSQVLHLVTESYKDYQNITLPYLNEQDFSIQWVYNILEKKAESEHIIYEDPDPEVGFVLLPDMKWDGQKIDALLDRNLP